MPHELYLDFQKAVVAALTTVTGVSLQSNCERVGKSVRVRFKTTPLGWRCALKPGNLQVDIPGGQ